MKFPSLVKIARPHRFNITPRYYDPIKDEIEQRTLAIKRQLEEEGVIRSDRDPGEAIHTGYGSSIRGAFKPRSSKGSSLLFEKTGLLRLFIFALLVGGLGGYLYLGSAIVYYLFYLMIVVGVFLGLKRLKRRRKNE
jgi:hypothetical protein